MKKLFAIRDIRTNKVLPGIHFSNKHDAKTARNELNARAEGLYFVVTAGPDHYKHTS